MRIYLASRYSRRLELVGYAEILKSLGHEVTSRWLDGLHEAIDRTSCTEERAGFAQEDISDLRRSEWCVSFTEPPGSDSRGGRHVEFGYALAYGKSCAVIGYRENVFHCLSGVYYFLDWQAFLEFAKSKVG